MGYTSEPKETTRVIEEVKTGMEHGQEKVRSSRGLVILREGQHVAARAQTGET